MTNYVIYLKTQTGGKMKYSYLRKTNVYSKAWFWHTGQIIGCFFKNDEKNSKEVCHGLTFFRQKSIG